MKRVLNLIINEDWPSLIEICPNGPEGQIWNILDFVCYNDKFESRNILINQVLKKVLEEME